MTDGGERHQPRRNERGATLVLFTLLITALMLAAAIVVDLGHMRGMRRTDQSLVDLAALAAGDALADEAGPDAPSGCEAAERYLRSNSEALAGLDLDCGLLTSSCLATTLPASISATAGSYEVKVTYPVSDASISDPKVAALGGLRLDDGDPCDRLRLEVERTSPTYFAGIVGWNELTSRASAVVRQVPYDDRRVPSLWMLDPYGCDVLSVQGGSQVTVGTATEAGLVSLDSDGSACSGNSFTVDVGGSGSRLWSIPGYLTPPGQIALFAMAPGQRTCTEGNLHACDPADVAGGTLSPQPKRRASRSTRAPVDHRYNCRSEGGVVGPDYPDYHGIEIVRCPGGSGDYIDQLRAAVGGSGVPPGFSRWTDFFACSNPMTPLGGIDGNWVVDCNQLRIGNGTDIVFNGGNVIFNGDITMTGGSLTLNAANPAPNLPVSCIESVTYCLSESSEAAAWAYMRNGDLEMTGGALNANHTAVYQHNGYFRMAGGSPPVWSAPVEGPFTSLAVWSELSSNRFQINGGASMELTGIFFTPEADPFTLNGGSPLLPQQAQFISYRAAIAGGATLTLAPLKVQPIIIPTPPALLIR